MRRQGQGTGQRGRLMAALALALGLAAWPAVSTGEPSPWSGIASEISRTLDRASAAHAVQQSPRGAELVSEAYFGLFEERGMEIAIRRYISPRRTRELERMFGAIRQAITAGRQADEVQRQVRALEEALQAEGRELDRQGVSQDDLRYRPDELELAGPGGAARPTAGGGAAQFMALVGEVSARYAQGARPEARAFLDSAYFDQFEGQGFEAAIGAQSPARKAAIEARFVRIRGLMASGVPPDAVAGEIDLLRSEIQDAIGLLSRRGGPWHAILAGALIIVREGFEAVLILTALVTYLIKAGQRDRVKTVYQAAGVAVVASLLTALALRSLTWLAAGHQELFEGVSMLAAAAVLVYVSYWLTSQVEAYRWQAYLRSKVQASLGTGRVAALWAAAFLAVYREGAETVLFYQALLAGTAGDAREILAGLGIGTLALAGLFVLVRSGAQRVPIRAFFVWSSILLYGMALVFVGRGVRALQTAGAVGASPTPWHLTLDWVGLYPTWESMGLQLLLLAAATVALVVLLARRGRSREETVPQ